MIELCEKNSSVNYFSYGFPPSENFSGRSGNGPLDLL